MQREYYVKTEAEVGALRLAAKDAKDSRDHQTLGERQEQILPQSNQKQPTLLIP